MEARPSGGLVCALTRITTPLFLDHATPGHAVPTPLGGRHRSQSRNALGPLKRAGDGTMWGELWGRLRQMRKLEENGSLLAIPPFSLHPTGMCLTLL
jgi:hypothetical protein